MATWVMQEKSTAAEPVVNDPGETHEKPEEKSSGSSSGTSELCTVSELVAAVERISGEKAPEQSPFFGDKTPEVLAYLDRHADAVMELKRVYTFTGCTVISKEYGELNAEHPGLLVEKAVIAYRELVTVTTFDDKDVGMWSIKDPEQQRKARKDFSRDFERDDNGNINDKRVGLWKFEKEEPQGSGKRSAKIIDNGSNSNPTEALRWDIKNPEENRRADKDFSRDYRKDENGNIDDERVGRWTLNPGNPQGVGKKSARVYQKPENETENGTDFARKWEYGEPENSGKKSVRSALTKEFVEEMQRKNKGGR
jgi:hypothetical protein